MIKSWQRRLLRLSPADLRLSESWARVSARCIEHVGDRGQALDVAARRLLGRDGHAEGDAYARRALHPGQCALGQVGADDLKPKATASTRHPELVEGHLVLAVA